MNYLATITIKLSKLLLFLIALGTLLSFATCKKSECIRGSYKLMENWQMQSQGSSINVGDTIILKSNISKSTFDYLSNANVDLGVNSLLGTSIFIRAINGTNNLTPAVDSFLYFIIKGRIKPADFNSNSTSYLEWGQSGNNYELELGIIAKKKGTYSFSLPDAIGQLNGKTSCGSSASINLTNSNINNNAFLILPYYTLPQVPANDSAHLYCIRVI